MTSVRMEIYGGEEMVARDGSPFRAYQSACTEGLTVTRELEETENDVDELRGKARDVHRQRQHASKRFEAATEKFKVENSSARVEP